MCFNVVIIAHFLFGSNISYLRIVFFIIAYYVFMYYFIILYSWQQHYSGILVWIPLPTMHMMIMICQ